MDTKNILFFLYSEKLSIFTAFDSLLFGLILHFANYLGTETYYLGKVGTSKYLTLEPVW